MHVTFNFYVYACTVRRRTAPVTGALEVFAMIMMMKKPVTLTKRIRGCIPDHWPRSIRHITGTMTNTLHLYKRG